MSNRLPPIHAGEPPSRGQKLLELVVPSQPDVLRPAIDSVMEMLLARDLVAAPDQAFVRLCLDEAMTNGMLHGNEGDPELSLRLELSLEPSVWLVTISDAGTGFTPECIPAGAGEAAPGPGSALTPALTAESGRGIRLMQAYMSELSYYRGGAVLVMGRGRADR